MDNHRNNLVRDFVIIFLSVVVAVILAKTGIFKSLLGSTQELGILGSFLAGIFFVSIFTAAPATVVLAEMAQTNSILLMAFFGGLGALLGDLIIFCFVKNNLSEDFLYLIKKTKSERLMSIFRLKLFRWLIPLLGAIVVASPLPDELGLMMMGLSKMKTALLIPLSFLLNSLGILIIGLIAKAII
ncbi:MAG: hypothetical protein AAB465_00940 [Patescibacteria group bacterium]